MPAKEIKELRKSGQLDEAYTMAKAELEAEPDNIWGKRNLSWVIYSQLDFLAADLPAFLSKIEELKQLALPETEVMLFENISIVISKAVRIITGNAPIDLNKLHGLFDAIRELPIKRDTKWFSVLYGAFHKGMKESHRYIEFANWWNFENFRPEDYEKEKMPNGREIMAIAEQAYISYAKHLLPTTSPAGELIFDKEKAAAFLPRLNDIVERYPKFQYPAYFQAKLLLALGDRENTLSALLPFAKKKQNDFWVWDVLAEAHADNPEKILACYCKALTCSSPEEMLVNLRQRMAAIFVTKSLYDEAKTEIEKLVKARSINGWKIPNNVLNWQAQDWYKNATVKKSNIDFYTQHTDLAETLLFSDIPEETVIVEFVNSDKKMLNFIASESKFGFFKYDRFLSEVRIGDVLKVRFQDGRNGEMFRIYTAVKFESEPLKKQFLQDVEGPVKIKQGQPFGFIDDVFIHPKLIAKYQLSDGSNFKGYAIRTYNKEKNKWGWKLI